jgi:hypothetical protein
VNDWVERLIMVVEVCDLNVKKTLQNCKNQLEGENRKSGSKG